MVALQSNAIDQIAIALSFAQAEMEALHKNAKNSFLNTRFADLAAVRAVCMPALLKHSIAATQTFRPHQGEPLTPFETVKIRKDKEFQVPTQVLGYLRTQLTHSSGQWIASEIPLACNWGDPHALGGTITYLRRYALAAICELAQDDDDGESAKGRAEAGQKKQAQAQRQRPDRTERFEDATPVQQLGDVDPLPPPLVQVAAPAPVPAAIVAETATQSRAVERPKTGLQLSTYASDQRLDPDLKHWIVDRFKHRGYPIRLAEWTPAQVEAAWPDIRDHLRRLQLKTQMTSNQPVSVS